MCNEKITKIKNCNKVIDTSGLSSHEGNLLIKQYLVEVIKEVSELRSELLDIKFKLNV